MPKRRQHRFYHFHRPQTINYAIFAPIKKNHYGITPKELLPETKAND